MISLTEARAFVLDGLGLLDTCSVRPDDAVGLVLADEVTAAELIPPFDNSAMDGFALRSADTEPGAKLELIGTVAAGAVFDGTVGAGQCVRIMTGAPMPDGADAVVMVERTEVDGSVVTVEVAVPAANHVRPAGDDMVPGDVALEAGMVITPAVLGVLRTLGIGEVTVTRRPRVGVMSTGDELVEGSGALRPGQIRDSNRPTLLALVAEAGAEAVDLGLIPDDEAAIETALRDGASQCDAILSSGGVSMGDFDFVKAVLSRIAEMRWMQVAIKPAKPLAFGTLEAGGRSVPVFGLPGNPVSSVVSFELFARPGIRKLMAHPEPDRRRLRAVAIEPFGRRDDDKTHFARGIVGTDAAGELVVAPSGGQGSHHTASLARADALVVIPPDTPSGAGDRLEIIPLG